MAKTNTDLSELLATHDQDNFLRTIAEAVLQQIMETDVEGPIGAETEDRESNRGYRKVRAASASCFRPKMLRRR